MQHYQEKYLHIKSIAIRMVILYLLNVADLVFTKVLIATGMFVEVNPILSPIIASHMSTLLKVGLAALLLILLYHRLQTAKLEQMRIIKLVINICLGLYVLINISHIIWLSMLI